MSGVQNQGWYNLAATRAYPFGDDASRLSDAGQEIPRDLLVDCQLRFPNTAGQLAYVGAATVSANLTTLVICAAPTAYAGVGLTPIASLNLQRPYDPYRAYPVDAIYPGTGGWVVLGPQVDPWSGRFSSPSQSLLMPRCARPYTPTPVSSIRHRAGDTPLTGDVSIVGNSDLVVESRTLLIEGKSSQALVFAFRDPSRSSLRKYAGPCGGRAESGSCSFEAIGSVAGIQPDCSGNINIRVVGGTATPLPGGIGLDVPLGLGAACASKQQTQVYSGDDLCTAVSLMSLGAHDSAGASLLPSCGHVLWPNQHTRAIRIVDEFGTIDLQGTPGQPYTANKVTNWKVTCPNNTGQLEDEIRLTYTLFCSSIVANGLWLARAVEFCNSGNTSVADFNLPNYHYVSEPFTYTTGFTKVLGSAPYGNGGRFTIELGAAT